MRLLVIVMIVLVLGALLIANKEQTNFKNVKSTFIFAKVYGKWLWQVGKNVKDLAVMAYNMKWLPQMENASAIPLGITILNTSLNISV